MTMQSDLTDHDPSPTPTAVSAGLFRALADPGRLTILRHLTEGGHNVRELTEHLGLAQSTVSAHLACLRDCGLVRATARGRSSIYSLSDPDALTALLGAADRLLAATGPATSHHVPLP